MIKCLRLPRLTLSEDPEPPAMLQDGPLHSARPRRRSEEDPVLEGAGPENMHVWMAETDSQRELLFHHVNENLGLPAKKRQRGRRIPDAGASVGYQMARKSTRRVYCCSGCNAWLVRPQDLIEDGVAAQVALDDCDTTLCMAEAKVRESDMHELETDAWRYQIVSVRCVECDAFLGVAMKTMQLKPEVLRHDAPAHTMDDCLLFESRGLRASGPNPRWLAAHCRALPDDVRGGGGGGAPVSALTGATASAGAQLVGAVLPLSAMASASAAMTSNASAARVSSAPGMQEGEQRQEWNDGALPTLAEAAALSAGVAAAAEEAAALAPIAVNQIFLGTRYLRLLDAHSNRPLSELVPLLCRACSAELSYTDQLLCTSRRWGFGGPPEPACFMNSLVSANVKVSGGLRAAFACPSPPPRRAAPPSNSVGPYKTARPPLFLPVVSACCGRVYAFRSSPRMRLPSLRASCRWPMSTADAASQSGTRFAATRPRTAEICTRWAGLASWPRVSVSRHTSSPGPSAPIDDAPWKTKGRTSACCRQGEEE